MAVLHMEDWDLYPSAVPHWETKNDSFLKMAALYKKMGIQNYYFHLALMQPELRNVDPHDPNLDDNTKALIYTECLNNPWYYIREVIRIKAGDLIPFKANRGNIALIWLFLNHIDMFLIQPRQTGKSTSTDALMTWLIFFGCYNINIQLITKDAKLRTDNILRLKEMRDNIPQWLIMHDANGQKDVDNTEEISYNANKIRYKALVPRQSPTDAEKVGRGATGPIIQFDEPPFTSNIGIIIPSAMGSTTRARDDARRLGTPYGIIYTTTAGKIDSRDGRVVYDLVSAAAEWTEHFFDAGNQANAEKMVQDHAKGESMMVNCTFSHRQLGYTDEWMWEVLSKNNAKGEIADRDYFNRWTNGTGSNPIDPETLKRITDHEREPKHIQLYTDGYMLKWYIAKDQIESRMATGNYILGIDTSDAIGRDGITMTIIDTRDLSVVATGMFNRTSIYRWISFLSNFMIRYANVTMVIERKSSAQTIIDGVIQFLDAAGIDPFRRIYNTIANDKEKYQEEFQMSLSTAGRRRLYETHKQHFGFNTTGDTRKMLYVDVMNSALEDAAHLIFDKTISGEFKGLVVKNGRIDHNTGAHDDQVISYLLAQWLLLHGKNLPHYGINTREIRSLVVRGATKVTTQDVMKAQRDKGLREEIGDLCARLAEAEYESEAIRLEQRIRFLMTRVTDVSVGFDSIQEIIDNAAIKRRDRVRAGRMNQMSDTNVRTSPFITPHVRYG